MLEWIVFKPRGPESGSREAERERGRETSSEMSK